MSSTIDLSEKLQLLREILKKKQNKEDVSLDELEAVGLTTKSRVKDIEKEIKALRTQVSSSIKNDQHNEELKEITEEAEAQKMTLEDYKEKIALEGREERKKNLLKNAGHVKTTEMKQVVQKERKKKINALAGEDDDE